jgi:hypothetical protein
MIYYPEMNNTIQMLHDRNFCILPVFLLAIILFSQSSQALRLTDGLYFTVPQNGTQEVYFILPDDVGAGLGKADYFITTVTDWTVDLTDQVVSTEENNTAIIPIRFFSTGRKEGDCSNYTVTISAPSLKLSKSWKGGVCLSKYADVDISSSGGDAKSVLNENVDLFSVGFRTYTKNARPGETVPVEMLVQSTAGLTIDVTLQSEAFLDKRSLVVQTNQSSGSQSFEVSASSASTGSYTIVLTAKARGCSLASCTKQSSMELVVSEAGPQDGFAISIFPTNLAIKSLEPVPFAFTIQNSFEDEVNFAVNVDRPFDLDSSLVLDNFTVPGLSERTVDFTVTPHNLTGFYEIKVTASAKGTERSVSGYLSTNEMVSDIYRSADDAKAGANSSVKAGVDVSVRNWYSSYSKGTYGANLTGYASLQDALDAARKFNSSSGQAVPDDGIPDVPEDKPSSPLTWVIIPIAIAGAAAVVIMLFRKRRGGGEGEEVLEFR